MKKVNSIIVIFLICVISFSCKKKKEDSNPSPVTNNSLTPYSVMQTSYNYADNGGVVTLDSNAQAFFFQSPIGFGTPVPIQVGNVTLNDTNLYFYIDSYKKAYPINISQTLNWTVSGSGTVTAFTHSFTPFYPKYTGGNLLPDTCVKASGITLNISGVSNLTGFISVSVSQSSSAYLSKQLNGNGTVTFTSSELSSFNTNTNLYFELVFQNSKNETLGSVLHSFNNNIWYNKVSYLK